MPARLLAAFAAVAASVSALGMGEARAAVPAGVLSQLGGQRGCVYDPKGGSAQGLHVDLPGRCASAESLDGAYDAAVSADGRNLYVASFQADSIAGFARDPATGTLAQPAGAAGCLVEQPFQSVCGAAPALDGISSVAVSPDGRNVYAASYFAHAVVTFARSRDTGELSPSAAGPACLSEAELEWECEPASGLLGATSVAVSPDGRKRLRGRVERKLGRRVRADACHGRAHAAAGHGRMPARHGPRGRRRPLREGVGLDGPSSVAVSPDGRTVYVTSFGSASVAVLARNRTTGALRQLAGPAGCLSEARAVPMRSPGRSRARSA